MWVAEAVRDEDLTGATAALAGAGARFYADDAAMLAALKARGALRAT